MKWKFTLKKWAGNPLNYLLSRIMGFFHNLVDAEEAVKDKKRDLCFRIQLEKMCCALYFGNDGCCFRSDSAKIRPYYGSNRYGNK